MRAVDGLGTAALEGHAVDLGMIDTAAFLDSAALLREHIHSEDNILYPMAEQLIPMDAMTKMSEDFQSVIDADEKNKIPAKYRALAIKLSEYLAQATSVA